MDETDLKNKTVVVTGGALGIGYQIADKYLKNGVKTVFVLDINVEEGNKAVKTLNDKYGSGKSIFMKCDVAEDLEVVSKKIFDICNRIDVLVNNAGTGNESNPRKLLEINTISVVEWSVKFFERMRKDKGREGGTIINIGSIYSFITDPHVPFYKASKYAVMGFTRSFGHEQNYQKYGVRMIVLCPGFTTTCIVNGLACLDEEHKHDFLAFMEKQVFQDAEVVGEAAVSIFKKASSGSAWKIVAGKLEEIPIQPYQLMDNKSTFCM